jgi:hypothetical protein
MRWRGRPWLALLPVAAGVLGWWLWWDRAAARWDGGLAEHLAAPVRVIGFPYRLQADFGPISIARAHSGASVEARAASATVERAFGRAWPHLFAAQGLVARAEAAAPAGAALGVEADRVRGSLHLGGGRLNRLSLVLTGARLTLDWVGRDLHASEAELHLRQSPGAPPDGRIGPVGELVLSAPAARLGDGGAPLALNLRATLTQRAPLAGVRDWAQADGALRIDELTLADATGPALALAGTVGPGSGGALAISATITTLCPATILGALTGAPAALEYRRRAPVTITLSGSPGRPVVTPSPEALASRPARRQEPPCPRLSG